jgi:hypothetical protein
MSQGTVRQWFEEFEQAQRKQEQGRAELARLGLVTFRDEQDRPLPEGDFSRGNGTHRRAEDPPPSPLSAGMHLALLLGAGMIASLAMLFG